MSSSLFFPNPQTRTFKASAFLLAADLTDPSLVICLCLQKSISPWTWQTVAELEWLGGASQPLELRWTGMARRVRMQADISRPVSIGMAIDTL